MLEWITANQQLLVAIFGAGGVGAIVLTKVLGSKKSGASSAPNVSASVNGDGNAIAHGGQGDMDVRINDTVDKATIEDMQNRLGISLSQTAILMQALSHAGIDPVQGRAIVTSLAEADDTSAIGQLRSALIAALERGQEGPAAAIVTRIAAQFDAAS